MDASSQITVKDKYYVSLVWYTYSNDSESELLLYISVKIRKDYTYYGKPNHQTCSNIQEKNLNSVKHLYITSKEIEDNCVNYFPNVNELSIKTSVDSIITTLHQRKEIAQILRFLLSKTHNKTRNLFYLCISMVPKVCLKETKMVIKSENLFNDHSIKYINRDLHLWW
ncbi:unnamed protein product [Rotaria sordida]|uniref:Uncharacterized protein n=1 Tax=Rotaria sordida TaxID=392033 RepID=A0A816BC74_9BILA|nr:unnamed protein product [Rotaria sordida]CAF1608142.1 unnamed protein product [Rotaria sordida]